MKFARSRKSLTLLLTVSLLIFASGLASDVVAQSSSYKSVSESTLPPQTTRQFVTVGEAKLHYVDNDSGRSVVMIHGNAGDLQDFKFGTLELMTHNYRTTAFDLPGHGLSKAPRHTRGTIREQAKVLHQALTILEVKNPILVGHSWGGAVALAYALSTRKTFQLWFYWRQLPTRIVIATRRRVSFCESRCLVICVSVYFKPLWGRRLPRNGLKNAFSPDPVPDDYLKFCHRLAGPRTGEDIYQERLNPECRLARTWFPVPEDSCASYYRDW